MRLCGGGFDDRYRIFFVTGWQFWQPEYVGTSFSREIAKEFINYAPAEYPKVQWRARIDPDHNPEISALQGPWHIIKTFVTRTIGKFMESTRHCCVMR